VSSHFYVRPRQIGFTLVELIVVLIIIGILGAIGAVRYFDRRGFDSAGLAEQTRAALRFSQKLAIAQRRPIFTQFTGTTTALCFANTAPCPATSQVPALGGNTGAVACAPNTWYCLAPPGTIVYAVNPTSATAICFNALGQPGYPSGSACSPAAFTGATVNIMSDSSTAAVNLAAVTVSAETGYVY